MGHSDVVRLLLEDARVDPSARFDDAIIGAARNGQVVAVEALLSHSCVDGTGAIPDAHSRVVFLLLDDDRCGIHVNRELFLKHHRNLVERFDELNKERMARICAMSWCMKVIGDGWGDLREPTEERMAKQPLNQEEK
jgi:hypothetical protein